MTNCRLCLRDIEDEREELIHKSGAYSVCEDCWIHLDHKNDLTFAVGDWEPFPFPAIRVRAEECTPWDFSPFFGETPDLGKVIGKKANVRGGLGQWRRQSGKGYAQRVIAEYLGTDIAKIMSQEKPKASKP